VKWFIAVAIALFLFSGAMPFLRRFGIGRLPGDFHFRMFGREWSIPLASTILLSLIAALIARMI
jgi:ABC-type phosphate transport system permease subunit